MSLFYSGGAWAESRESEIAKHASLAEEKKLVEAELVELMSGSYPLTIASEYVISTLNLLKEEMLAKRSTYMSEMLSERLKKLRASLNEILDETTSVGAYNKIESAFYDLIHNNVKEIVHDVSETKLNFVESIINDAIMYQKTRVDTLSARLSELNNEIDKAGKNIARAPEESQIKPLVNELSKLQEVRATSVSNQKLHVENYRRLLRDAMDTTRELDKISSTIVSDNERSRMRDTALGAKQLLSEFSIEIAKRKVKDLECEFLNSFSKLARKDDLNINAKIDPKTFMVSLVGGDGRTIEKDELSAGEKQIYAISILEALAKTSGRRLPIIIDTPLGRLDSVHRTKLIQNYFPTASHQVIILSTDTEVDEEFYTELSPEISHAFKLDYDNKSGSTVADEGYFWRG